MCNEEHQVFINKELFESTVVVLSGGVDSTVLLHFCKQFCKNVTAVSFDYGQCHKKELTYAQRACQHTKTSHRIVDLSNLGDLLRGNALTDFSVEVPDGHYTDESMKKTVVPNRNMIMLSIAAAYAISLKFKHVAYAAHVGDHTTYPDCRPKFITRLSYAIQAADWHEVKLFTPFASLNKTEICELGKRFNVHFEDTWSCYKGGNKHCGVCGTCVERREAFKLAKIPDPTEYEE